MAYWILNAWRCYWILALNLTWDFSIFTSPLFYRICFITLVAVVSRFTGIWAFYLQVPRNAPIPRERADRAQVSATYDHNIA